MRSDLPVTQPDFTPWKASKEILERGAIKLVEGEENSVALIELQPSDPLFQLVMERFAGCHENSASLGFEGIKDFEISSVKYIRTPDLEKLFEDDREVTAQRGKSKVFSPQWSNAIDANLRHKVDEKWRELCISEAPDSHAAKTIPLWHVTPRRNLPSLLTTGFAALSTTDIGYFGKGIYGAADGPEYPLRAYGGGYHATGADNGSQMALLFCFATCYSPYPVASLADVDGLAGKLPEGRYDGVNVPVTAANPYRNFSTDSVDVYLPGKPGFRGDKTDYHEFVVTERARFLASCVVELKRKIPTLDQAVDYLGLAKKLANDENVTLDKGKHKDAKVNKQRLFEIAIEEAQEELTSAATESEIVAARKIIGEANYNLGELTLYQSAGKPEIQRRGLKKFGSFLTKQSREKFLVAIESGYNEAEVYAALAQTMGLDESIVIKDEAASPPKETSYTASQLLAKAIELKWQNKPDTDDEVVWTKFRAILSSYYVNLSRVMKDRAAKVSLGAVLPTTELGKIGFQESPVKEFDKEQLLLEAIKLNPGSYYAFDELAQLPLSDSTFKIQSIQFTEDPSLGTIKAFGKPKIPVTEDFLGEASNLYATIARCLKSIKLNEGYAPAFRHLARCIVELNPKLEVKIPFPVNKKLNPQTLLIRALELDESDASSYALLSLILTKEDKIKFRSSKDWKYHEHDKSSLAKKAMELDGDNPLSQLALAQSLEDGEFLAKKKILLEAYEKHPNHPEILFALADNIKKNEKAFEDGPSDREILEKAIFLKPDFKPAVYLFVNRYREDDKERSEKYLIELLKYHQTDPKIWSMLGELLNEGQQIAINGKEYKKYDLFIEAYSLDPTREAYDRIKDRGPKVDNLISRLRGVAQEEAQRDPMIAQGLDLYVAQEAVSPDNKDAVSDLLKAVNDFIRDDADGTLLKEKAKDKVLHIKGDVGAGKTLFGRKLEQQLWSEYSRGKPIPLFISLSQMPDFEGDLIGQALEQKGFDREVIKSILKDPDFNERRFVFVIDGDDKAINKAEVVESILGRYKNSKVIVSSKFSPERDDVATLDITPFSQAKIADYINEYANNPNYNKVQDWSAEKYQEVLNRFKELKELAQDPAVLPLILSTLPMLETKDRITKDFYEEFAAQYIKREVGKLKRSGVPKGELSEKGIPRYIDQIAQDLSFKLWEKNLAYAPPGGRSKSSEQRSGRDSPAVLAEADALKTEPFLRFFGSPDRDKHEKLELARRVALLRESAKGELAFLHKSIQEFYAAKRIVEQLLESDFNKNSYLNRKLLTIEDSSLIRFMAEYIPQRMIEEGEALKEKLFEIVDHSKTDENVKIAAANAMTILNTARVPFSGRNLAGVKISGAILVNGLFDHTNLSGADLTGVDFSEANLNRCELTGAIMEGVTLRKREGNRDMSRSAALSVARHPGASGFLGATDASLRRGDDEDVQIVADDPNSLQALSGHAHTVSHVVCSGKYLISSSRNAIWVWDMATGERLRKLEGHTGGISGLNIVNGFLASQSYDKTSKIWNIDTGECIYVGDKVTKDIVKATSADKKIFICGMNGNINVYDKVIDFHYELVGHSGKITSLAISPDVKTIVSGSSDNTIKIWDVKERKCLHTLVGHTSDITSVAISPNSKFIVSGSRDDTIKIWDIENGKCLHTLTGHAGTVTSVTISPDGKTIISGSRDKTIKYWQEVEGDWVVTGELSATKTPLSCIDLRVTSKQGLSRDDIGLIRKKGGDIDPLGPAVLAPVSITPVPAIRRASLAAPTPDPSGKLLS